ncbi:MAG TPA: Xaa-Pro peptidase family protein [Planctomycetota bacterium]|jgi:Xaa-Pro aminopeptidase
MMRFAARWLVLLLLGGSALAQETRTSAPTIPVEEYGTRRAALRKAIPEGLILMEADPLTAGMDNIDKNTPVYDFSYLAGYHREGDILAIDSDGSAVLFADGKPDTLKAASGIEDIRPRGQLAAFVKTALPKGKKAVTRLREKSKKIVEALAEALDAEVESGGRKIATALTRLRLVKSPAELDMMRKASDATNKAHLEAMKACRPGMNEKLLQKVIEDKFKAEGCDGLGFPSIVGSGKNGTILHYNENKDPIPAASLVVCDIGASYRGYVTDITRTLPTSGKFTEEHKKAYQCVLDAQKAAEAILKPGVTIGELHSTAGKVFEDRGMTDYSFAHNQWPRGHGVGHQVGMAVHDSDIRGVKLAPGMVITIEPGYYNWKDGFGIRIEDIYIVTRDGFERMSAGAPREVDEIEKIMKKY